MANLNITTTGLVALTSAKTGGFKLSISTFKVTEYSYSAGENPGDNLKGVDFYTGDISSIETVSESTVRFNCTIPKNIPNSGTKSIGEIGLYLDNGELFAVGKISPNIIKDSFTNFTIFTSLAASKLGGNLSVNILSTANISKTFVDNLSAPNTGQANILGVVDGSDNSRFESPTLAVRFGATDSEWGFVGFTKVASVKAESVVSKSSFVLDPNLNGFWLNNSEVVICQIVSGAGAGQTRKFKYSRKLVSLNHVFDTINPFTDFDSSSVINFWKDSSVQLPDRRGVPHTQVLFAGEDSYNSFWDTSGSVESKLKLAVAQFNAITNQYIFIIPATLPSTYHDKNNVLLFIDGKLMSFNDFNIYNNQLITAPFTKPGIISLYVFYRVKSLGSHFKLFEEVITLSNIKTLSGKPTFNLPFVPEDIEDTIGFTFNGLTGEEIKRSWGLNGAILEFNTLPKVDTLFLVWGFEDIPKGYSQVKQYEWYYSNNNSFSVDNTHRFKIAESPNSYNYILFINGEVLSKSNYTISNGEIIVQKSTISISQGDYVRFVWILNQIVDTYKDTSNDYQTILVEPNKLIPSVVHESSLTSGIITIPEPINDNYVIVFKDSLKLEKDIDWRLKGSGSFSEIVLDSSLDFTNSSFDVLSFSEDKSKGGFLLNTYVHTETINNQVSFDIEVSIDNEEQVIAFVDGLYLHKNNYSILIYNSLGSTAYFSLILNSGVSIPTGCKIEIIAFVSDAIEDSRTDVVITKPSPYIGFKKFKVDSGSILKQNTLMFVGPVYQHKNVYRVDSNDIIFNINLPYSLYDSSRYGDMPVEAYSFVSGKDLANLNLDLASLSKISKPAKNTGPYWADPAGTNKMPNKMKLNIKSFSSTRKPGTKFIFDEPPAKDTHILVFVHGLIRHLTRDFIYLTLKQIEFVDQVPDTYPVDIITFSAVEDDVGTELSMKVFEIISDSTNSYTISYPLEDESNVMIFVEGVYFHKEWYRITQVLDLSGNVQSFHLTFPAGLINDLRIEVNIWHTFQSENSYTEMLVQYPNPAIGAKNVVLTEPVLPKNTMVFAGPIYQNKSSYKVNELTLQLDSPVAYHHIDPINFKDLTVAVVSFRTGPSKTRLITRDEVRDKYLTKHGGDLLGPLYTQADPESDLEVANKRYVDSLKVQIEQMQDLIAKMQGLGSVPDSYPILAVAPNLIRVGSAVTIKIVDGSPGKSVELELRGSSGIYNSRSIKGVVRLDGTFNLGPVGIDNGYSDYITVTAWVDGFKVANTVDIKVTDSDSITGVAMLSSDKEIYTPFDYITYAIADGTPGGKVTWSINGGVETSVPAGQQQFIGADGTWSMQVPSGGVPTSFIVEFYIDTVSVGTLSIIVSPTNTDKAAKITFSSNEIYRDEIIELQVTEGKPYSPVTFSAKAVGMGRSGPVDTAGLLNADGSLNSGFRFASAGDYIIYVTINKNLFTHSLKVKKVSPVDTTINEQVDGYRAYIKQY